MNSLGAGKAFSRMAHDFPAERAYAEPDGGMAEKNRRAMVEADEYAIYPSATQNREFAFTCTLLQQKIETLRKEKAELEEKAGQEQVMRALTHLVSSLEQKSTGGPGFENLELAAALLSAVRTEIYNKGFKSWNKYRIPPCTDEAEAEHWHAAERLRRRAAHHESRKINEKQPDMHAVMEQAMVAKGHQCVHLNFAAAGLLKKAGIGVDTHELGFEDADHAVLLIGRLPPVLPSKLDDWPPELAICDGWANIACAANRFVPNMLKKLDKWRLEGKVVFNSRAKNWLPVPAQDFERQMNRKVTLNRL